MSSPNISKEEIIAKAKELRKQRDALLKEVLETQGPEGLKNLDPVRIKITAPQQLDHDLQQCKITLEAHPLWEAVLSKLGASKRGQRTWAVPVGKNASLDSVVGVLQASDPRIAYLHTKTTSAKKWTKHPEGQASAYEVPFMLRQETEVGKQSAHVIHSALGYGYHPLQGIKKHVGLSFNTNGKEMFVSCFSIKNSSDGLIFFPGAPDLNLWPLGESKEPAMVKPIYAAMMLATLEASAIEVEASDSIKNLAKQLSRTVIGMPKPGAPAQMTLLFGSELDSKNKKYEFEFLTPEYKNMYKWSGPAEIAFQINDSLQKASYSFIDSRCQDMLAIAKAKPRVDLIDRPYQQVAVGRHLATSIGYINASPVGSGKTPMTLVALNQESQSVENYKALVACGSSVVGQWASECKTFAPNLEVHVLESKKVDQQLEYISQASKPQVLICSHSLGRAWHEKLLEQKWNTLAVDEAHFLKNPSSKGSVAFWLLRAQSEKAVGLTGTPVNKTLDDLGAILAWVFNDKSLFYGERLSKRFDMSTRKQLWSALGEYVFKPDPKEIEAQMPQLSTHVEKITAHPSELKLAQTAHKQLKDLYANMIDALGKQADEETDELSKELILQAKEEMEVSSHHQLLSGVQLARLAASSPEAINMSNSSGAALLQQDGLVDPAAKHKTKQKRVVEMIAERTIEGQSVLVFTDFVYVAEALEEALQKEKIACDTLLGKHSAKQRTEKQAAFQGTSCAKHSHFAAAQAECPDCQQPKIQVLILTGAGREGINLQRAHCIIHYELPWTPSQIIQRLGRTRRIGGHKHVEMLVPLVEDTIEEHVAQVLLPRIAQALQALDDTVSLEESLMGFNKLAQDLQSKNSEMFQDVIGLTLQEEQAEKTPIATTQQDSSKGMLQNLKTMVTQKSKSKKENYPLKGKKVVITGKLSKTRDEWENALQKAGAIVQKNVAASTDVVLVGDKPGTNLQKAQAKGIPVLYEKDLGHVLN